MNEISNIQEALKIAVKKDSPSRPWPVYRTYEPIEEGGVSYVVASVGLFEEIAEKPKARRASQTVEGTCAGEEAKRCSQRTLP